MRILDRWSARTADKLGAIHVFRPTVSTLLAALWAVVTVIWLFAAARAGIGEFLLELPIAAFGSTVVYATCVRPLVAVRSDGVLMRNVLRDVTVPWRSLREIGTQYALTLTTEQGRRFTAWAAPAANRFSAPDRFSLTRPAPIHLETADWDETDGTVSSSSSGSDSTAAAAVVRRVWLRTQRNLPDGPLVADEQPTVRWAVVVIAALVVTLLAAVLAVALNR